MPPDIIDLLPAWPADTAELCVGSQDTFALLADEVATVCETETGGLCLKQSTEMQSDNVSQRKCGSG